MKHSISVHWISPFSEQMHSLQRDGLKEPLGYTVPSYKHVFVWYCSFPASASYAVPSDSKGTAPDSRMKIIKTNNPTKPILEYIHSKTSPECKRSTAQVTSCNFLIIYIHIALLLFACHLFLILYKTYSYTNNNAHSYHIEQIWHVLSQKDTKDNL